MISNLPLKLHEVKNKLLPEENQLISTLESSLTNLTNSIAQLVPVQGIAPLSATTKGILQNVINQVLLLITVIMESLQVRVNKAVPDENTALVSSLPALFDILRQILVPLATMEGVIKDFTN
ncbi:uncharacterized protein LOC118437202 [Folsomia candida]|uniref:uncharacterized protein LOC118437202 n=1 Tax=Folsomia candida TaxID=158441 RepID=UPI0016050019|nr:uncharacterized protein LOC118437202 [Folsomia candida]